METGKNKNSLHEGYLLHWYEIKRVIGRGGFGITYLAHDNNLDRYVAIKEFMPEDFATRESDSTVSPKTGEQETLYEWGLERFIKEAQTLAKFNHPNIVHVLSVFEENNTAYMIMEYAQGEDLSTIYKKSPKFTEEQFLDTFIPILDGLALIHNAGFIHRDIKPANIYICDNSSPLLLDFGSARQSIGGKTKALTSLVTFGYAPYEQYNEGSEKQGPWTDIYSLGACIHVGITGQKPVDALQRGGSFLETGLDAYQPLSIVAKGLFSENFLLAIDNALMFKIGERPQNILTWADMLLGKTLAPELPEYMFKSAADDKTIIQPAPVAKIITAPSQGPQGLVDTHGKRNAEITDTMISNRSRSTSKKPDQVENHPDSISNVFSDFLNRLRTKLLASDKPWLPITIGSAAAILLIIVISTFINDTPTPETTETRQELEQQKKQLKQLLSNANKAISQKKYVTPDKNNAHYFYRQVLKIEPNNQPAIQGIKKIESQLLLLARAKYDNGEITASQKYLKQLYTVNPKSDGANKLANIIKAHKKNIVQLNKLLIKAYEKLSKKKYINPENDNAFYFYQQALILNPDNQEAKNGIKTIEGQLYLQAKTAYENAQYTQSLKYLAQLKSVNPESKNAKTLQNKINKNQSQHSQIASWLNKATRQKNNNRYTSPKNDNAFDTYNKILKLEPENKQASDGLKNIRWYYKAQFNRHISASQLSKADADISIMKKIGAPSSTINQMQAELKTSRRKQIAAKVNKTTTKQLDIHQASKKVGQFKSSIENHNKNKLNRLSMYMPGRKQFVDQLFSQYNRITVKVSSLRLIPKENKATAEIELANLVDINNNNVTPGSWNKFEIVIRYNNNKQLKVYW